MRYTIRHKDQAAAIEAERAAGFQIVRFKAVALTVAFRQYTETAFTAKAWRGTKATIPAWHYSFNSRARLDAFVTKYAERMAGWEKQEAVSLEKKKAARAALKASDHFAAGDVLYTSWGYDQTNVDFYQVTEVKARSIVFSRIRANSSDCGGPSGGKTSPRRFDFCGEPITRAIREDGRCSYDGHGLTKWDGRALYCSSYA